jgi:hypothetical protein
VAQAGLKDRTVADESELVARLRAGDERAFEALVELVTDHLDARSC